MRNKNQKIPVLLIYAQFTPEEDYGATCRIESWVSEAQMWFENDQRFYLTSLFGTEACRERILHELDNLRETKALVVFYGVGCECGSSLFGTQVALRPEDEPLIPAIGLLDVHLLYNKIVYVVSCHSAKFLGRHACEAENGALCYIGYGEEVYVSIDSREIPGLRESVNIGLQVLQNGGTCCEARERIHAEYQRHICCSLLKYDIQAAWALISSQQALYPCLGRVDESLV